MGKIDRNALYTPGKGELVIIRGAVTGRSVDWTLRVRDCAVNVFPTLKPDLCVTTTLTGDIVGAGFNDALDARIKNQKESISRLMEHLGRHCPHFFDSSTTCPYEYAA